MAPHRMHDVTRPPNPPAAYRWCTAPSTPNRLVRQQQEIAGMRTITIIESDVDQRDALLNLLQHLPCQAQGYATPAEFLLADEDAQCSDFLVVDFDAPQVGGFDFLRLLHARHVMLPTVLLTSRSSNRFKAQALTAGAIDVIDKPLINELLLARIRQYLPEIFQSHAAVDR